MERVNSVRCSERKIIAYEHKSINDINCWDDFNSPLQFTGEIPYGLYFENNTIYGYPITGKAMTAYSITSERDIQNPYIIYIGGMWIIKLLSYSIF